MSRREEAENQVLEAIASFESRTYGPSVRDLSTATGLGTGTIHDIVISLAEKKLVTYTPGVARSVRVLKEET